MRYLLIIFILFGSVSAYGQATRQKEIKQRREVIKVDSAQVEQIHNMPMDSIKTSPMPVIPKVDTVITPGRDTIYNKTKF